MTPTPYDEESADLEKDLAKEDRAAEQEQRRDGFPWKCRTCGARYADPETLGEPWLCADEDCRGFLEFDLRDMKPDPCALPSVAVSGECT